MKDKSEFRKEWYLRREKKVTKEQYFNLIDLVKKEKYIVIETIGGKNVNEIIRFAHNPYLQPKERLSHKFKYTNEGIKFVLNKTNKEVNIIKLKSYKASHFIVRYNNIIYKMRGQRTVVSLLKEILSISEGWIDDQGCPERI